MRDPGPEPLKNVQPYLFKGGVPPHGALHPLPTAPVAGCRAARSKPSPTSNPL